MRSFIFMWQDEDLNMCYFQFETNSYNDAWKAFDKEHGVACFAVIEGSNMKVRDFNA